VQREGFAEGTNSELIKQSAAGVTGAAAIGTKTGRNILGKAFKGLAALDISFSSNSLRCYIT
jgi:hypothetical protein